MTMTEVSRGGAQAVGSRPPGTAYEIRSRP